MERESEGVSRRHSVYSLIFSLKTKVPIYQAGVEAVHVRDQVQDN